MKKQGSFKWLRSTDGRVHQGDVVQFTLVTGAKVIGFYEFFDEDMDSYMLSNIIPLRGYSLKKQYHQYGYGVKRENIKKAMILLRGA